MILASNSPRRKEILENFGFNLKVITKNIDEVSDEKDIIKRIEDIARKKVLAVAFERPADGTKELILGFDYVLTDAGETVSIPVELEILNEKNEVLARTAFRIPCERGKNTTVRGNFLTSDANGGIGIDPDYDGDLEVDLGEL